MAKDISKGPDEHRLILTQTMFPREPETTSNDIKRHQTTSNDIKRHPSRHSRLFHTRDWKTILYGFIIRILD